ncbi:hypothetical protein [Streptomyces sp. NPDC055912]|uniref:hypothetical protein n=1 Tax=Streptomyces sp. NPDC055912 TaxID=3345660 RepID=UPI0035DD4EFF
MSDTATLTHEYAERVLDVAVVADPELALLYPADTPSAVPPIRPDRVRLTYTSRNGAQWVLDTVECRGPYVITTPALAHYSGLTAAPLLFFPNSPFVASRPMPSWLTELVDTLRVPGQPVTAPGTALRITVIGDRARRTRYFRLGGTGEIPHWFPTDLPVTVSPLRPDRLSLAYLSEGGAAWQLDAAEFRGPYVATGVEPGPHQNEGHQPYYPRSASSLEDAPDWVLGLLRSHASAAALPQYQPH